MKKPITYLLATSISLGAVLGLTAADDEKKNKKDRKAKVAAEEAAKKDDAPAEKPAGELKRGERPDGPGGPQRRQRPDGQGGRPGGDRRPGGGGPGGPSMSFADLDTDNNGAVSLEEFVAAQVKQAEERATRGFEFIDADKNGSASEEELRAFGERMRERFRGSQGGRPPGAPGADRRGQGSRPGGDGDNRPPRPKRPDAE